MYGRRKSAHCQRTHSVTQKGKCCLHFPETLKNTELAELLIESYRAAGISVDLATVVSTQIILTFHKTLVHYASLLQDNNETPLMVACTIGDLVHRIAELLLKNGANPDGDPNVSTCIYLSHF